MMKMISPCLLLTAIFGTYFADCTVTLSATRRVRILSYNIHAGVGEDEQLDLGRIADVIIQSNADLVALQEVDRGVERSNGVDQPAVLARLTGMHYAFEKLIDFQGGEYGNAVLSRYPIECHRNYFLPRRDLSSQQRGLLEVRVLVDSQPFVFYSSHFDHKSAQDRLDSVPIARCVLGRLGLPGILAGDLNAKPSSEEMSSMTGFLSDSFRPNSGGEFTAPASAPKHRIDYILHNGDPRLSYVNDSFLIIRKADPNHEPSDHLPIYAEYQVNTDPNAGGNMTCPPNPPMVHVDKTRIGSEHGTPEHAYHTLAKSVLEASGGEIIAIRPGTYIEPQTVKKHVILCTYDGNAVIR